MEPVLYHAHIGIMRGIKEYRWIVCEKDRLFGIVVDLNHGRISPKKMIVHHKDSAVPSRIFKTKYLALKYFDAWKAAGKAPRVARRRSWRAS